VIGNRLQEQGLGNSMVPEAMTRQDPDRSGQDLYAVRSNRARDAERQRRMLAKIKETVLDDSGQGLVEFALVTLFVIIPVMVAIVDGSILLYKWVAVNNAAREGARAGAIYQDSRTSNGTEEMMLDIDADRETAIMQAVDAVIGPLASRDDGDVTYPECDPIVSKNPTTVYDVYRSGCNVQVAVTHSHTSLLGLVIGVGNIDLTATATMKIERGGVSISAP
jgi:Flp pilus assembly protein TadG